MFCIVILVQAGVGNNGGKISAHERASWLDALQSSLHGLEEVLSKRSLVDRAARREADALGGPAVVSSMLDLNGGEPTHASTATTVLEGGDPAKTPPAESGSDRARMGWLSGAQLKAFEAQVQARCVCRCIRGVNCTWAVREIVRQPIPV